MKVTLKEWNAIATWHWNMPEDEVCGICRVQFDGTCPTCKFPGDDCSLCEYASSSNDGIFSLYFGYSTRKMWPFIPYGESTCALFLSETMLTSNVSIAS